MNTVIKNNVNVYMTSQKSATTSYLVYGILGIILAIAIEVAVVWNFFHTTLNAAIGAAVIMQLSLVFALLVVRMLPAYLRRTNFMMCFVLLEDANVASVKQNYHVCFVDEYGILFVDKKDVSAYNDWLMLHNVTNLREVKEILFPEPAM